MLNDLGPDVSSQPNLPDMVVVGGGRTTYAVLRFMEDISAVNKLNSKGIVLLCNPDAYLYKVPSFDLISVNSKLLFCFCSELFSPHSSSLGWPGREQEVSPKSLSCGHQTFSHMEHLKLPKVFGDNNVSACCSNCKEAV